MQKFVYLLSACILFCTGCASITGSDILSDSEIDEVIDIARYIATSPLKDNKTTVVSRAEVAQIKQTRPKVKIQYTGPRQGKMALRWQLKTKAVNLIYTGKFLTNDVSWKMSIAKHKTTQSKKKLDPFRQREQLKPQDFNDMLKDKRRKQVEIVEEYLRKKRNGNAR